MDRSTKSTKIDKTTDEDQGIMLELTIKPLPDRPRIWHIHVKEIIKKDEKEKESEIPHDVFGYMLEEYTSILDFVRAIHHSTYELRRMMKNQAKRPKRSKELLDETKKKPISPHKAKDELKLLEGRRKHIEGLLGITEKVKGSLKTEDMLHQAALALALEEFSYNEIKKIIKEKTEFKRTLHITDYPNLQNMQQTQSASMFETLSGYLNFGSSLFGLFHS